MGCSGNQAGSEAARLTLFPHSMRQGGENLSEVSIPTTLVCLSDVRCLSAQGVAAEDELQRR